jgi:hypothetical protein
MKKICSIILLFLAVNSITAQDGFINFEKNAIFRITVNSLHQLKESTTGTINDKDGNGNLEDEGISIKGFFSGLKWWEYFLFVILFAGIGFGSWLLYSNIKLKNDSEPINELLGKNESLKDFASRFGITLNELVNLNKKIINKKFEQLPNDEQKQIQKRIREDNTQLFAGYKPKKQIEDTSRTPELNDKKQTENQQYNQSKSSDISQQLSQVEYKIIEAIKSTNASGNNSSNEIIRLKEEISILKNNKSNIESEKESLNLALLQLKNEKENLDKNLIAISNESSQHKFVLSNLQEKIIQVDYLSGYCENVLVYLNLCKKVTDDAYSFFNRINQQKPDDALIIEHFLIKFQNNIQSIPLGNWTQIIKDIKDTSLTSNILLIRSFSEINSIEERKREFQRLLFSEVSHYI